jgi:Tfp pilus assembly protein PilX
MQSTRAHKILSKQTGSTLIVTLIILILVMLLGVTALSTSDTQAKLTGNLQFENVALNKAEEILGNNEAILLANPAAQINPQTAAATVPAGYDPLANTAWQAAGFEIKFVSLDRLPGADLKTICSDLANPHTYDCVNTYLVTAIGTSSRGASKVVQSFFSVPLN